MLYHAFDAQPESPKYERPRDETFEYLNLSFNNQHNIPSVGGLRPKNKPGDPEEIYSDIGATNDGYTPLARQPLNIESAKYAYTHLIYFQKEKGETTAENMEEDDKSINPEESMNPDKSMNPDEPMNPDESMNPEDDDYIYPNWKANIKEQ